MEDDEFSESAPQDVSRPSAKEARFFKEAVPTLVYLARYHWRLIGLHAAVTVLFNLMTGVAILAVMLRLGVATETENFQLSSQALSSLHISFLATLFALLAAIGHLGLLFIESRVIVAEDRRISCSLLDGSLERPPGTNIPRVTSYFGRLSKVVVVGSSSLILLVVAGIVSWIILPASVGFALLLFSAAALVMLYLMLSPLGNMMTRSMTLLLQLAPEIAAWKRGEKYLEAAFIDQYYGAYFRRIFLSSALSLAKYALLLLAASILVFTFSDAAGLTASSLSIAFVIFQLCGFSAIRAANSATQATAFLTVVQPLLVHNR